MRNEVKSALGGRKFLVLGISSLRLVTRRVMVLIVLASILMTGLSFGQGTEPTQEQEQQGQPATIYFFGTNWQFLGAELVKPYDDLGVDLFHLYGADVERLKGTVKFFVIVNKERTTQIIIAAWFNPFELEDLWGLVIKDDGEPLYTKSYKESESLIWKEEKNQKGNSVLKFIWIRHDETTGERIEEVVRTINIKEYVEKHFKDGDASEK